MDVKVRVEDDSEEEKITAGSIVTITTTLTRRTIGDIIDAADRGEVIVASSRIEYEPNCIHENA